MSTYPEICSAPPPPAVIGNTALVRMQHPQETNVLGLPPDISQVIQAFRDCTSICTLGLGVLVSTGSSPILRAWEHYHHGRDSHSSFLLEVSFGGKVTPSALALFSIHRCASIRRFFSCSPPPPEQRSFSAQSISSRIGCPAFTLSTQSQTRETLQQQPVLWATSDEAKKKTNAIELCRFKNISRFGMVINRVDKNHFLGTKK